MANALAALDAESAIAVMTAVLQHKSELADPVMKFCIPDLTYPPTKMLTERRGVGTVKSFNEEKGFGFIDCKELKEIFGADVFVHKKQIEGLPVGTYVNFAVALSKDCKPQAYDVCAEEDQGDSGKGGKGGGKGGDWLTEMLSWYGVSWDDMKAYDDWNGWGKGKGKDGKNGGEGKGEKRGFAQAFGGGGAKPGNPAGPDVAQELGTFIGVIKSFNEKNGYGFIMSQDCQAATGRPEDVFVHHAQAGGCTVGGQVQFTAFLNTKGKLQGKDCVPLALQARRRTCRL